ncbi:LY6E protein, partial [Hippolais icterina]|nr:LY6E protein [Hippolais icterina]
ISLFPLFVFLPAANALYCYTCTWEQSNWRCLKAEKCSDKDEYCVTNVASVGIGRCCLWIPSEDSGTGCFLSIWKRITKKCSSTCPHHNFLLGLTTYTSYCCQSFLCNLSACPG